MTGQWSPRYADGLTPHPPQPSADVPDPVATDTAPEPKEKTSWL
jgi:hypothetical protein